MQIIMGRVLKVLISFILVIGLTSQTIMSNSRTQRTETPEYRILKKIDRVEIREYPELIMASTIMGSSYGGNSGRGFSTVARYIFGGNEKSEKISMTSPVVVDMADTMKMSFIMPSKYDMSDLPKPSNPGVELSKQKPRILAVISFSGWANDNKLNNYREMLAKELKKHNMETVGDYMYFGYNPPYKLINRRNEVAVELKNRTEY